MYVFECPNGHISFSAAKETRDDTCPECGEDTKLATPPDDALAKNQQRAAVGKAFRIKVGEMRGEGKTDQQIAEELDTTEERVGEVIPPNEGTTEIVEDQIIWFPVDAAYKGRQGEYAKSVKTVPPRKLIRLVTMRAIEDGRWSIENGHVGENEDLMRRMMKWVSRPENIIQCADANPEQTVDAVCRELAQAAQQIAGGMQSD